MKAQIEQRISNQALGMVGGQCSMLKLMCNYASSGQIFRQDGTSHLQFCTCLILNPTNKIKQNKMTSILQS